MGVVLSRLRKQFVKGTVVPNESPKGSIASRNSTGVGSGGGSFAVAETSRHFRTLVYKKRRLSDATLEKIVVDPVVSVAFRKFLHGEFGEQKLLFWIATNRYRCLPEETPLSVLQQEAALIYNTYLVSDAPSEGVFEGVVDTITRETIARELGIKTASKRGEALSFKVTCKSPNALRNAFLFAAVKVFQDIKFTYLPVFVTSEEFESLRGEEGFFKDVDDAYNKASLIMKEMDTSYILTHPVAQHRFLEFVCSDKAHGTQGHLLTNLYLEVDHFLTESRHQVRKTRLELICSRYKDAKLKSLDDIIATLEKNPKAIHTMNASVLQPLEQELVDIFSKYLEAFKQDPSFNLVMRNIASSSVSDFNKVSTFFDKNRTRDTIIAMQEFRTARNLSYKEREANLEMILGTSQGRCFFKRFAIQNFMEDSIEFWIQVETFRSDCEELGDECTPEFLQAKGRSIVDSFLLVDSLNKVNISDQMRQTAVVAFNDPDMVSPNVFDIPQREVFKLMKDNLWLRFKELPRYNYLVQRCRERGFLKETQGRVGQLCSPPPPE